MIKRSENIKDPTLAALVALATSSTLALNFYPCGSRFFGYAASDSDFDFFAMNDDLERDWLKENHFVKTKRDPEYLDINTREIWLRGDCTVILVHSPQARLKLQDAIIANPKLRPKKGSVKGWNELYQKFAPEIFPS